MGIEEVPSTSRMRAYDYANSLWRNVACNASGEIGLRRGELLITTAPVLATAASGGQPLGSGRVDRVILNVPNMICSGSPGICCVANEYSGYLHGIWVGGKSGTGYEPYPGLSGKYGCVTSGKGLFLAPGSQKELYVQRVQEIYVAGTPSGYPVTWVGEQISE